MTLWDVDRLFKYWQYDPPSGDVIKAIAKVLGITMPQPKQKLKHMNADDMRALMRRTGGRIEGLSNMTYRR